MSDTEEDLDPQELLEKKHRQEKKELQAKIQELKKTITKGDSKKKKKEVNDQIAKLEGDLEQRHSEEMLDLLTANIDIDDKDDATNNVCDKTEPAKSEEKVERVSKAQKRRDKKAEKEKQRLIDIEKQDEENLTGLRNMEQEAINKLLETRGLSLHEIASDGDCMFAGLVHQLSLSGESSSVSDLRQKTGEELRTHQSQYLPFLSLSPDQFEVYCNKISCTSEWGGQVELLALANILQRPIEVIQSEGGEMVVGDHYSAGKLILTYHRHVYGLGEHYNSVTPLQQ